MYSIQLDHCWILRSLLPFSPSLIFVIQNHPDFLQLLPGKFQSSSGDILREPLEDISLIQMYAISIIIIIIIIIGIINIYHHYYLESYIVPHYAKRKKEKDCTTYDMEIFCLTMEI